MEISIYLPAVTIASEEKSPNCYIVWCYNIGRYIPRDYGIALVGVKLSFYL